MHIVVEEPRARSAQNLHEVVIDLIKNEERGKVLDAPAGEGAISKKLHELGFSAFSCDIAPETFKFKGGSCAKVDLNKELPYKTSSFDHIICVEGIEHLENPWHLIREFSRILKRNGTLIVTTPNVLNLFSRFMYFINAELSYFSEESFSTGHINPVSFTELKAILEKSNFKIESIATNQNKLSTLPYLFLNIVKTLLTYISSFYLAMKNRRIHRSTLLSDKTLMTGEILVVKARKKL
jgi:2-polyprenyl-3-methyl-5-hydroxy-6-metoxy-1,4-benzoquinol methylase